MWRQIRPAACGPRLGALVCRRTASTDAQQQKVVFSGIQPTGTPHLGNYGGAIKQWVKLQDEPADRCKLIYSVVDLHAITMPQQPGQLRQWKRETLAALLAAGINPERSTLFYQSSVPAHSELMWILSCTASMGYLSRMTQWKSKLSLSSDTNILDEGAKTSLKLGLFSYPVLQAADILVHRFVGPKARNAHSIVFPTFEEHSSTDNNPRATHVPVGDDQRQHLEFARECATNFNHTFGPHLVSPQTITCTATHSTMIRRGKMLMFTAPTRRVMSLIDPSQKMSKSARSPKSRILITDTPEEIEKRITAARTDTLNDIWYDPVERPGVSNLLEILSIFDPEGKNPTQLGLDLRPLSFKELKRKVSDAVIQGLAGIRERYIDLISADEGRYLDSVEAQGAKKARQSAEETMAIVREATGL